MEIDKELLDIVLKILSTAEPKMKSPMKSIPSGLLDRLSERLAELGL